MIETIDHLIIAVDDLDEAEIASNFKNIFPLHLDYHIWLGDQLFQN
jgi:hypothetical protein